MKKLLLGLTLSSSLVLAACGGEETTTEDTTTDEPATEDVAQEEGLQDGTYRIEDQNFGETGWKEALEISVSSGEITEATWESVDEEGNNKIEDDEYQEAMANVSDVGPQDFIPALEEDLVASQDPAEVEVVTGATSTSEKFQDYAQQLVDAAEEGNTETIQVDNAE